MARLTPGGHVRASVLAPYRWLLAQALRGAFPSATASLPAIPTTYLHGADDRCCLNR